MARLAKEEEMSAAKLQEDRQKNGVENGIRLAQKVKRAKTEVDGVSGEAVNGEENEEGGVKISYTDAESDSNDDQDDDAMDVDSDDDDVIPVHESVTQKADAVEKAACTVFLGNVSTAVITSNSQKATLLKHLKSPLASLPSSAENKAPKLVSLRFRSTPYSSGLPNKKAAFATQSIMNETALTTNAYAVYSSPAAARAACKALNGTVVLGRHLRVDSVAHPAQQDYKRCVFIGNLGFTAIEADDPGADDPNAPDWKKKKSQNRSKRTAPEDPEEGLWTHFATCGTVESVRVVRDAATRIGKGFAYVQFTDANAVEKALLLSGQKFPPMLPRKVRVERAKRMKKKIEANTPRRGLDGATEQDRSLLGRAPALLGKGGARELGQKMKSASGGMRRSGGERSSNRENGDAPVVFEGHRARANEGNRGLKFGKTKGKPSNRSVRRAEEYRKKKFST
jgi:nucleolar protein 12